MVSVPQSSESIKNVDLDLSAKMDDTNNMTWVTKTPYSDKNIKSVTKSNSQPAGVFAGGQGMLE